MERKRGIFKEVISKAWLVLVLAVIGEIIAGIILSNIEKFIAILPGALILIPVVMGTRGNIMGMFGSRLTSALHLGDIKPTLKRNLPLSENVYATLFLSLVIAIVGGILAHFTILLFGLHSIGIINLILIVVIASFFADCTLIVISTTIAFISFKRGSDPDNILLPITTTLSDFMSVLFLVLAIGIIV